MRLLFLALVALHLLSPAAAETNVNVTAPTADADSHSLIVLCSMSAALAREPFAQWEMVPQPYWLIFVSSCIVTLLSYCYTNGFMIPTVSSNPC